MTTTVFSCSSRDTLSSGKGLNREHKGMCLEVPKYTDEEIANMSPKKRRQYFDLDRLD